ncbi:hypothetical protein [Nisaea denitrificans]|uniref:hypothetical protein n=1 Tax=Nisaea denitrificans TaxID=390877 RepID=UPI00049110BD|nr:hypothetical protein [Nisaea denitrificans]
MIFFRTLLVAMALLLSALPHTADAQTPAPPIDDDEAIPPSGLGATTVGQRVILLPDGTWKIDQFYSADEVTAMSDHGRVITLSRTTDPATKHPVLRWKYARGHGGPLQIVVSRAITTDRSKHSTDDNCIPVLTIRNLTNLGLFRIIAEVEFTVKDGSGQSATSVMAGPLDDGEEGDYLASPLFLETCKNLEATVNIPYCTFENGLDCRDVVTATQFGTIPAKIAAPKEKAAQTKQN